MLQRAAAIVHGRAGLRQGIVQVGIEAQHVVDERDPRLIALAQRAEDLPHLEGLSAGLKQVRRMKVGVEAALDLRHRGLDLADAGLRAQRRRRQQHLHRASRSLNEGRRQARRGREGDPGEAELSYDHAVNQHAPRILHAWLLCTTLGLGVAQADGVRLRLEGAGVPYVSVEYVLAEKRGTVVAESNKRFAQRFGHQEVVAVLTRADLDALLDALEADGIWALRTRKGVRPVTRWTIDITRGARKHQVIVDDPALRLDGRHLRVIDRVRARVQAAVPPRIFQDPMLLPSEGGTLNLRTLPIARVRLDGVLLPISTPIKGLRVQAGRHTLEFLPSTGGPATPYNIAVEAGRATSLNLKLE